MVSMKDIRAVGRRIAREFRPQQVILFGSHARGAAGPDSDVKRVAPIARLSGCWHKRGFAWRKKPLAAAPPR